jgi:hypothetical protein
VQPGPFWDRSAAASRQRVRGGRRAARRERRSRLDARPLTDIADDFACQSAVACIHEDDARAFGRMVSSRTKICFNAVSTRRNARDSL